MNETDKDLFRFAKPEEIEIESFAIIDRELRDMLPEGHRYHPDKMDQSTKALLYRIIHTSADFEYVDNLYLSKNVFSFCLKSLLEKPLIITDTSMAAAGINKPALTKLGGEVHCFIRDPEVMQMAKRCGRTRASVSMDKSLQLIQEGRPLIYAIGNAPTALIRLYELVKEKQLEPALIIAAPVGFVNVVESKQRIKQLDIPFIVAGSRKGGSNIAAALCNALIYLQTR